MMISESYIALARNRSTSRWPGYKQPEDFGYDFRDWVSPYTKGAHTLGGVAIVLQDWSSEEKLLEGVNPEVQLYGRTLGLRTNKRLDILLSSVLKTSFADIYATNIFPFIKPGGISSRIPWPDVIRAGSEYTKLELEMACPSCILALGKVPFKALTEIGVKCVALPHPAARIGGVAIHEKVWREALGL